MNDRDFSVALGAWEDRELARHYAGEVEDMGHPGDCVYYCGRRGKKYYDIPKVVLGMVCNICAGRYLYGRGIAERR